MNEVIALTPPLVFLIVGMRLILKRKTVTGCWVVCIALALEIDAAYALKPF